MSINERIKQVRHAIGLTQVKLAGRISVSVSYLAEMEHGKKINDRIIRLFCAEFNVDEHWLRTGEGSMWGENADVRAEKAMSVFKSLPPRFQDCALVQINELAELYRSIKY